jgi:hypothetical protein
VTAPSSQSNLNRKRFWYPRGMSAIDRIGAKLPLLTPRQLNHIEALVDSFVGGTSSWANPKSDFATNAFVVEFGDTLLRHHNSSKEPLSKDRFGTQEMPYATRQIGMQPWPSVTAVPRFPPYSVQDDQRGLQQCIGTENAYFATKSIRNGYDSSSNSPTILIDYGWC